jgi:hypothetical protein
VNGPAITRATPDRVPALASVLAAGFEADPMVRWPFHDHDVRSRAEPMFAGLLTEYQRLGIAWEAGDGAGVAGWIPPGSDVGLAQANVATWPLIPQLTDDGGARYRAFWGWLEAHVPTSRTGCSTWWRSIPRCRARGSVVH